jgi:hypothetical protein
MTSPFILKAIVNSMSGIYQPTLFLGFMNGPFSVTKAVMGVGLWGFTRASSTFFL